MEVKIKLRWIILLFVTVGGLIWVVFSIVASRYQSQINEANTALYEANRDISQYEIIVDNLAEHASEQELLVVSTQEALFEMEKEGERLRALNMKHVRAIGELQLKIEALITDIPPVDTLIIYKECDEVEGSFIKLPQAYRYQDDYIKTATLINEQGLASHRFTVFPFDMPIVLGTKRDGLFKREVEIAAVTTTNPYVDVEDIKFIVVDKQKKPTPVFVTGVGVGIIGTVVLSLLLN